jgi:hypothetical protein
MKAILRILLSIVIVYWVAVAATFTSIYVFPETAVHIAGAIDSITEVIQDELPSSSVLDESSEEETSSDDVVTCLALECEDSEPSEESEESIPGEDEEETTEPEEETEEPVIEDEEETTEPEEEGEDLPESEPLGRRFSSLPEDEEVVLVVYTPEEIAAARFRVEQFLFESMLVAVPLSFLVIFLNSKLDVYVAGHQDEIEAEKAEKLAAKKAKIAAREAKKLAKKSKGGKVEVKAAAPVVVKKASVVNAKVKTVKIGLTGLEVKK